MVKEPELKVQSRLSPTSINSFKNCPRCYFVNYILGVKTPPSIHLVKGTVVHSVLEDFFKRYRADLEQSLIDNFNRVWDSQHKEIKLLEMTDEEILTHRKDCMFMITEYYHMFRRQMNMLISLGKAENDRHAYYLLKPKFREMWVEDKELHCCGYIDRVNEDYDGQITLGDYKTSSKFGLNFPLDYKRQLAIYALLYKNCEGVTPDEVAVDFLRYGEIYRYEVTDEMLSWAEAEITDTWEKTRSTDINDYQPNPDCSFKEFCGGFNEDANERLEELRKFMEEK